MPESEKLLVIGLDGATFDLIGPWARAGHLPHLSRLMAEGVQSNLLSTIPPLTPAAWSAFITGLNPGRSGVFDFLRKVPGAYRTEASAAGTSFCGEPFWRILNRHGKRCGLVNLPMTFPAEPIEGFVVACGLGTTDTADERFLHPPDLFDRHGLDRGAYVLKPSWKKLSAGDADAVCEEIMRMHRERARVTLALLNAEPWDYFFVQFHAIDWAEHAFFGRWHPRSPLYDESLAERDREMLLRVHKAVDRTVGEMLDAVPKDTPVLLLSDHGHGPTENFIYLNEYLRECGYLVPRKPTYEKVMGEFLTMALRKLGWSEDRQVARVLRAVLLDWYDAVPGPLKAAADVAVRQTLLRLPRLRREVLRDYLARIDFRRTRAYTIGQIGGIYINRQGRDPLGVVPDGEAYETLRNEIVEAMLALKGLDGKPAVERVYKREELFAGPHLDRAPDLVAFADRRVAVFHPGLDGEAVVIPPKPERAGHHKMIGIFIARGFPFRQGAYAADLAIADVMPAMLYVLGVPVPPGLDGELPTWIFDPGYLEAFPAQIAEAEAAVSQRAAGYSAEEERLILARLRDLGYVD